MLSDSTTRVDAAGKEQRDRLDAEVARRDTEIARLTAEVTYWRDHYFAATQHHPPKDQP